MPKTRPDGSPLTPDDLEYWNQPYTFQEFPKMLYRRQRSGLARLPAAEKFTLEGTYKAPDGTTVLEYITVVSAAEEANATNEGWADLPNALAATADRKGHKRTGVRLAVGDVHRARAELEFLRALNELLPDEAFDTLNETSPALVSDWADQWHINYPCVLEAARSHASLAQAWRDASGVIPRKLRSLLRSFGESYRDEPIPEAWLEELARLNRLPPTAPSAWPAIASEEELRTRRAPPDAWEARDRALQRPEVLAPLVTDGCESFEELLQRLHDFWSGRRARYQTFLEKAGLRARIVRPTPEIARDARWVVRVRVKDERPSKIAESENVDIRAVETAVRRFEKRLRLKTRRRGRPPRRTP